MSESMERLRADCERCVGLCCVALPFSASADFAVNKPADRACAHLTGDHRCGIHSRLRESGFQGCTVFDCYGAGQRLTRRADLAPGPEMFAVFRVTRRLHELLWLLTEAADLSPDSTPDSASDSSPDSASDSSPDSASDSSPRRAGEDAGKLRDEVDALVDGDADALLAVDVDALRARAGAVLEAVSARVRAPFGGRDLRRADLAGARLRAAGLRGAALRGALLIAADLRGADLRTADLLGADLRDAALHGADLTGALFLTQPQLAAARGDSTTALPAHLTRPGHWPARHPPGQHEPARHMRERRHGKSTPDDDGDGGRNGSDRSGFTGRGGRGQGARRGRGGRGRGGG
ncbi:pentapeptide repeat-containing protein [Streptomyces axinellae]|uniref:Pentapeptide repeat-containing protein n=1 Tax=Streptomyces axinellae TaxID=552788 RepID=A0ABN3PW65_9ACTN